VASGSLSGLVSCNVNASGFVGSMADLSSSHFASVLLRGWFGERLTTFTVSLTIREPERAVVRVSEFQRATARFIQ
jgi:hypothetical protein